MEDQIVFIIIPVVLIILPLLWIGTVKLISLFGWSKFTSDRMMATEPPPDAEKFTLQTVKLGSFGKYEHSMSGWVHHSGLYLRPIWLFRIGHPLITLNWDDIIHFSEQKIVRLRIYTIKFRTELPEIRLYNRLGTAAYKAWAENSRHAQPMNKGS
mgnify:CR=1 FL=1